jgi:DNA invertase Pin-like site-specific DNA recombinase
MEELERKVRVYSASPQESFLNTMDSLTRKLILGILGWLNEKYREDLIARTKAALDERKHLLETQGSYVSKTRKKKVNRLGNIPWIYDKAENGELKVNPERLSLAKRGVKMWYNKGTYGEISKKIGVPITLVRSIINRRDFYNKFPYGSVTKSGHGRSSKNC